LRFFRNALAGDLVPSLAMFATPFAVHALADAFAGEGDRAAVA
jgi:hypothetical protein